MNIPPVLLIVFNRPQHTQKVFDAIRKARPSKLYIAVDGARDGRPEDIININTTLCIFENIDWPCEVKKLIRESNFGCKMAVSSAISWFFSHEEQGIILEDDCLPSFSFFTYCYYLLEKYKHIDHVMHINGVNFQDGVIHGSGTYYFSKVCHVWGWASWRRAWNKYDIEMNGIDLFFQNNNYMGVINYPTSYLFWSDAFLKTKNGLINTWDYQWVFSIWKNNGLCIAPNYNLISNIGFDEKATHTKKINNKVSNKPIQFVSEIIDVDLLIPNYNADTYSFKNLFSINNNSILSRIKRKVFKHLFK